MTRNSQKVSLTANQEAVLKKLERKLWGSMRLETLQLDVGWGNRTFQETLGSLQRLKYVHVSRDVVAISEKGRKAYKNRR
jgi:hypothetical protein